MRGGRSVLAGVGTLLALFASLGLGVYFGNSARNSPISHFPILTSQISSSIPPLARGRTVYHPPPLQPASFFHAAWEKGEAWWSEWLLAQALQTQEVRSLVLPHHLLVADRIAGTLRGVAEQGVEPTHIILLAPNHFLQGTAPIALSESGAWVLPDGSEVRANAPMASALAGAWVGAQVSEVAFHEEHGISALLPFIVKAFPDTPIVPIVLQNELPGPQIDSFAQALAEQMPDALLIASIDFSHYLPRAPQEFHDAISRACLVRNGCETELEVDAMSVLRVLWAWNKAQGSERFTELSHTSSVALGATEKGVDNTSHFIGWYTNGEPARAPLASFLFTGDIMLDRRVRRFMEKEGVEYPWKNLDRWIRGTDAVIGNLEGTVNERPSKYTFNPPFEFVFSPEAVMEVAKRFTAVSLANNHARDVGWKGEQETRTRLESMGLPWFGGWESPDPSRDLQVGDVPVTLIGYHAFRPDEAILLRLVREADARERFVIVLPHWGNEYQFKHSAEQERLAKAMVEAGADLIVGMHPHVVQDAGDVNGVPVFYSLGNFIFDQEISATWPATGMGVILDGHVIKTYALPIWTRSGQPKPLEGKEAEIVYERLQQSSEASPTKEFIMPANH